MSFTSKTTGRVWLSTKVGTLTYWSCGSLQWCGSKEEFMKIEPDFYG